MAALLAIGGVGLVAQEASAANGSSTITWAEGGTQTKNWPATPFGTPITFQFAGCQGDNQGLEVSKYIDGTSEGAGWGFYPPITRAAAAASFTLTPPLGSSVARFNCFDYTAQDADVAAGVPIAQARPAVKLNYIDAIITTYRTDVAQSDEYRPLTPARLLDTRPTGSTADGRFAGAGIQAANSIVTLDVAGRQLDPNDASVKVPYDAKAVTLNVTVTGGLEGGFVTVYPCGTIPNASNLNFNAGQTIPNAVTVKLSALGTVCISTTGATNLIVDVNGFFPQASTFIATDPTRLMDTRIGGSTYDMKFAGTGTVAGGTTRRLQVGDRAGIPMDAKSVVLNVTVASATASGFMTVFPCDSAVPNASNLNYSAGQTIPNMVITKVGPTGEVCFFADGATDVIVDVNGFLPASSLFVPRVPIRVLDTRTGGSTYDDRFEGVGPIAANTVLRLPIAGRQDIPASATTVLLNVTVASAAEGGFLTVYPCTASVPNASNLNYQAGQTIPNAVIAQVANTGEICIFASGTTNVIVDMSAHLSS